MFEGMARASGRERGSPEQVSDRLRALDDAHARAGRAQKEMLRLLLELDRAGDLRSLGARDASHLLQLRYGLSAWKAHRWVAAARALQRLPRLSRALERGELGIDKVLELCRYAEPVTEAGLIAWARRVSLGAVRRRGDLAARASALQGAEIQRERHLGWWYSDGGRRFWLEAELPAADGAIVARTIERLAGRIPAMPGEEDAPFAGARRADALVALCSARVASDPDPDRATVVIHAQLAGLTSGTGGCEIQDGGVVHPATVQRLLCSCRVQSVHEDRSGGVLHLGRVRREPPAWMLRQIRYRDRGCTFPGCGTRAFTEAHHIRWFRFGGRTELGNLALVCSFHHRLVHEHGWSMRREPDGVLGWFRPDGTRYRAGPSPGIPLEPDTHDPPVLTAVG